MNAPAVFVPNIQPQFPDWLDSTMVSCFKACPFKFFLEYVLNYKPKAESVHLVAGASYAKGLEVARKAFYVDGKQAAEAEALGLQALLLHYGDFECPADSAKSAERTAGALEFYFDNYPLGADGAVPLVMPSGRHGIEFTFAEPIEETHPVTGAPMLYCGGSDMVAKFANGVFIEDDKTTSSLGPLWSRQWDLRSQFTGYKWGLGRAGIHANGVLVRGVSILKTKYETQQAITYRHDWQVEQWYASLLDVVREMKRYWGLQWWRQDLDKACADYGGCTFRQVCLSNDKQPWLDQYFERRLWNPLTRQELML